MTKILFVCHGSTHPSTGRVAERIGKEWVIDKSLLDFIFSYLYLYFIVLDFPTSVFPLSDYPTTEMLTTAKRTRHVYLCLALYRPYRAPAEIGLAVVQGDPSEC